MAEITRKTSFWDPATGYSDDVVVNNSSTSAAVTVKRGMLLLSDGAGKYSLASNPLTFTVGTSYRLAIALEDVEIAKASSSTTPSTATIKAVKSGVVSIEGLYEVGGYDTTSAPVAVLDEFGGISNIVFVHVKEVK